MKWVIDNKGAHVLVKSEWGNYGTVFDESTPDNPRFTTFYYGPRDPEIDGQVFSSLEAAKEALVTYIITRKVEGTYGQDDVESAVSA